MSPPYPGVRICVLFLCFSVLIVAVPVSVPATAAAAANVETADYEYDASDLLIDDSATRSARLTLTPNGNAEEGDTLRIELDGDHPGFDVSGVTDATGDDIGISPAATTDAIEIELTDLRGKDALSETNVSVDVELTATDVIAGRAATYDATPIASVTVDETSGDLVGDAVMRVTVDGRAEIEFDADTIDQDLIGENLQTLDSDQFVLTFSEDSVLVDDGDTINLSVNPRIISEGDEDGLRIVNAAERSTLDQNISSIDVATSGDANVLDGHDDQITITVNTVDGEPKLVSGEAVAVGVQLAVETESMKRAADRYRDADFLTVDVEGEDNAALTQNSDVRTESPVVLNIYPGEAGSGEFELDGIESGDEFGIGEGRTLAIDGVEDRFGNEIPRAKVNITLSGHETYTYDGVWTATDGTNGMVVGEDGALDAPVGAFDLSVEVIDVPGPATQSRNTGSDVTERASGVGVYPDNVTLETTTQYRDFDVDGDATIEVEVDLGVSDERIDRLDLELRREGGNGTVRFERDGGAPTATDPWEETGYGGDGHLGQENAWMIERDLTAADFDGGTRRYVLDADVADRYEIGVAVMPSEGRLVPDASKVATSLSTDPGGANRDRTEIVATGSIDAVSNVSVRSDHEFVGVDADEGAGVQVEFEGFEDANGNVITNTDEAVSVGLGNTEIGDISPVAGESPTTVQVDPTTIDGDAAEIGTDAEVTVEVADGTQRNRTNLTLVHRAIERSGGAWRTGSISQPATLYVDAEGSRDLAQWNPETGTYVGISANGSSDTLESHRIGHEQLHRGMYAYAESGSLRIGFEYVTTADEAIGTDSIELEPGWHFGSSNYGVSTHATRRLERDANWVDDTFGNADDAFVIWDEDRTDRLHDTTSGIEIDGADEPIGHDDAYWIEVEETDDPLVRRIVSPTYSRSEGGDE
ncbi:MAG: hypothetical protein RI568_04775 [Natronomonas sp.]|uniref:hypothetical protein n=1 Tax=Natronomonas sp. TaxID=2184060 RepID=UPI00286FC613|nr:hypothetical protein [Natronomonas sp.]MDR9430000.1 hypothetical protein [Natronomonas sp.]